MERHETFDKRPIAEMVGIPRPSDGVGQALRETFAPIKDETFGTLLAKLDRQTLSRERGG